MKDAIRVAALCCVMAAAVAAAKGVEFSTAGFYSVDGTGREVFSMNPGWRFVKGDVEGAERADFDDSGWAAVNLPHGIEYLPAEASGCVNYQGIVWYRKHFVPEAGWSGKRCLLHFEAVMGKCRVYVNGSLVKEHFGGYLPVVMDVTGMLKDGEDNVIAVMADNSDDPMYPPGKPQKHLDYTYCGGIYRDCWMVTCGDVHVTDPNLEDVEAGGGLFAACTGVEDDQAHLSLKIHIRNEGQKDFSGTLRYELKDSSGKTVAFTERDVRIGKNAAVSEEDMVTVFSPMLWSPSSPVLYDLYVTVLDRKGTAVDGFRQRTGLRIVEFRGAQGLFLNGKPYGKPLIGANRHQDFAVLGNAVPNSMHWRDVKKLKDAGMDVVRNAHCPQDPAFMDACDELGVFVIDNIPGWQFWNREPVFGERVCSDIRSLVRRDRNHACLWLWEPVPNETGCPESFVRKSQEIVHGEFPYPGCWCGADEGSVGTVEFPVLFAHPQKTIDGRATKDSTKSYFTREWGDNVDDWGSHNSTSRVSRNWGEIPMLVQARHYADLDAVTNLQSLYSQSPQHVGGCLWHSFDHQRGYHPDPFYGGIMDNFRQPKFSYFMFRSQRSADEAGPMVYIAHEMTPFSDRDVTVYSNCEEVRLTFCSGGKQRSIRRDELQGDYPSPVFVFDDMYDFMTGKMKSREGKGEDVWLLAEGVIGGKVVATHKVTPSRRPEKLLLWLDDEGTGLKADGSDCAVVVAAVADGYGRIKRLSDEFIRLEIEGEGRILGDAGIYANPSPVRWGTAAFIVRSTTVPGKIRLRASLVFSGEQKASDAVLEFESVKADFPMVFNMSDADAGGGSAGLTVRSGKSGDGGLEEVMRQQEAFGEK